LSIQDFVTASRSEPVGSSSAEGVLAAALDASMVGEDGTSIEG